MNCPKCDSEFPMETMVPTNIRIKTAKEMYSICRKCNTVSRWDKIFEYNKKEQNK